MAADRVQEACREHQRNPLGTKEGPAGGRRMSLVRSVRQPAMIASSSGSVRPPQAPGRARTARPRRAAPSVDAVAGVAPRGAKITLVPTHAAMHNDQAFQASSPKTSGAGLRAGPFFGLLPTGDGHDRAAPRRSWLARMSRCDRPPVCPSGTPPFDRAAIKERRLCSLRTGGSNPSGLPRSDQSSRIVEDRLYPTGGEFTLHEPAVGFGM